MGFLLRPRGRVTASLRPKVARRAAPPAEQFIAPIAYLKGVAYDFDAEPGAKYVRCRNNKVNHDKVPTNRRDCELPGRT